MENLEKLTLTGLQKLSNDLKYEHELIKNEIIEATNKIDELDIFINKKLKQLEETENKYVQLVEEIDKR
jgi:hypothetical protein